MRTEEGVLGTQPLAPRGLVPPEPPKLDQEGVRQEHVASPAVLGDLGTEPDPALRLAFRRVDIADVQTYNLGQPQAGPERQGVDQVVPWIAARGEIGRAHV